MLVVVALVVDVGGVTMEVRRMEIMLVVVVGAIFVKLV